MDSVETMGDCSLERLYDIVEYSYSTSTESYFHYQHSNGLLGTFHMKDCFTNFLSSRHSLFPQAESSFLVVVLLRIVHHVSGGTNKSSLGIKHIDCRHAFIDTVRDVWNLVGRNTQER